jgi:peroxiredoxin
MGRDGKMMRMMRAKTGMLALSIVLTVLAAGPGTGQSSHLVFRSAAGQTIDLADEKKVIVLSFSATWAPLASKELPALQTFADAHAGRGVSVYWVSINSSKQGSKNYASDADLTAFAARYGLKLPVLRDADQDGYRSLGLSAVPTIVVLDRNGKVALRHVGFDPEQAEPFGDVAKAVAALRGSDK